MKIGNTERKTSVFVVQFTIFLEGAQISKCEDADSNVDGGSFKYFRIKLTSNVQRVAVEIKDIQG